jgi:hypothetical protein
LLFFANEVVVPNQEVCRTRPRDRKTRVRHF